MREIRFRQWGGKKFYHWGINVDDCTFVGPVSGGGLTASNTVHQQYTGLKDKNGIEVYEGDVWLSGVLSDRPIVVDFACGQFNITRFAVNGWATLAERGEVLGNIYENPELMEIGK